MSPPRVGAGAGGGSTGEFKAADVLRSGLAMFPEGVNELAVAAPASPKIICRL